MSALDACRAAHAAYLRSSPQLFLEVDDLTSSASRVDGGGTRPNPTSGDPRGADSTHPSSAPVVTATPTQGGASPEGNDGVTGAETVRPATNGKRERATVSPAYPPLPRGEAVRDGLAATPLQTKERR